MDKGDFELDPGQWATLRRLLDEALEREPLQRAAWLDSLDGPQAALIPRLRDLLEHATGTLHLRMNTLPKVETADFAAPAQDAMPERIGPYRLLREIGSGGMASVWLAERTDMLQGRQVALKLPHGAWRRAGLAERMAREREILATLNHPNIARLYAGGVAEAGQPYLALEYVEAIASTPTARTTTSTFEPGCACSSRPRGRSRTRTPISSCTATSSPAISS